MLSGLPKEVSLKLVLTLAALTLLAALLPVGAAESARRGVFPYPIHTRTLDNGLSVVVIPMSSNGLCAFWSVVRTGSRDEFEPGLSYREQRARFEEAFERRYVAWLLERHESNVSAAAREADMDRKYLYKLAKKHGLKD